VTSDELRVRRITVGMKSRRQSSGGSSGGATAAGVGNTHSSGGGCKLERKDVEKNRRLHMKGLCLKLSSLIPPAARRASLLSEAAASASNPNKVRPSDPLLPRFLPFCRSAPSEPADFCSNGVLGSSPGTRRVLRPFPPPRSRTSLMSQSIQLAKTKRRKMEKNKKAAE